MSAIAGNDSKLQEVITNQSTISRKRSSEDGQDYVYYDLSGGQRQGLMLTTMRSGRVHCMTSYMSPRIGFRVQGSGFGVI